jgi:hypothetical protein
MMKLNTIILALVGKANNNKREGACMVCGVVHNMICSITTHTSIHGDQTCDYLGVTIWWLLYYRVVLYNDLIDWICNNLDLSKQGSL